jgi:F-type H+-transporting ATPase subunit b
MLQFDWTTFFLEVLNFLVLVWILQRLLYNPVLTLLDARQQKIQTESDLASQARDTAEQLRSEYESRLQDWSTEQQLQRQLLEQELAKTRNNALEKLKQTLADESAKLRNRNNTLTAALEAELLQKAKITAYQQAANMLKALASPQLTQDIIQVFLQDLSQLSATDLNRLQKAGQMLKNDNTGIEVLSAHPLSPEDCQAIQMALSSACDQDLRCDIKQDPDLIAGVRILAGDCLLLANLADELAFFSSQNRYA